MQAPGGPKEDPTGGFKHGGWTVPYFDDELGKVMGEQMSYNADLLLGRKTFEIFASYWPNHEKDWPGINDITKYVASNTLSQPKWNNSIILNGDIIKKIKQIKTQEGSDIQVHGSSHFIQTLLKHDLVDEFWLKIFPITLGTGKKLFGEGTIPAAFKLVKSSVTPSGVIIASYAREGEIKTGSFGDPEEIGIKE